MTEPDRATERRVLRILAITDPALAAERTAAWVDAMAEAGVDAVQIRLRGLDDRRLFDACREAVAAADGRLRVLINGRADLALAADACGVHLPAAGLPPSALERWQGRLLVGLSTHRPDEVATARPLMDRGLLSYVTFGPFAATPSKAAYGPPPGPDGLRRAAAHGVPVLALGGIDAAAVPAACAAGATGIAAIRACRDAASARRLVAAVRHQLRAAA